MNCSLPGSSIHGIFQARVLEWGAIAFSRGSSWPRDRTQVSCIAGRCLVGKEVVEMEVMVKVVVEEGKVMVRLVVVELLRLVIEKVMVEKPLWALLLSILRRSYHLKDKSQLLSSTKCFMIQLLLTSLASLPTNHTKLFHIRIFSEPQTQVCALILLSLFTLFFISFFPPDILLFSLQYPGQMSLAFFLWGVSWPSRQS